jgi:TATA-box binding protein (TBP) (component of TFIID and TFIIIB)
MPLIDRQKDKPIVNIENVVASAILHQSMSLNDIVKTFPNVEYKPVIVG